MTQKCAAYNGRGDKKLHKYHFIFDKDYVSKFFGQEYNRKLLEEHKGGNNNHGREIYNIFSFLVWYQVYFVEN